MFTLENLRNLEICTNSFRILVEEKFSRFVGSVKADRNRTQRILLFCLNFSYTWTSGSFIQQKNFQQKNLFCTVPVRGKFSGVDSRL